MSQNLLNTVAYIKCILLVSTCPAKLDTFHFQSRNMYKFITNKCLFMTISTCQLLYISGSQTLYSCTKLLTLHVDLKKNYEFILYYIYIYTVYWQNRLQITHFLEELLLNIRFILKKTVANIRQKAHAYIRNKTTRVSDSNVDDNHKKDTKIFITMG